MSDKIKNVLKYSLAGALTVLLVYLALKDVDWEVFMSAFGQTRWGFVALSLICALMALIFRVERWHDLMLPVNRDIRRIDLWDSCNIGNLVSVAVPWVSIFVRCGIVTDKKTPYDKTLGTILMERAWDCLMVLLFCILAIFLNTGNIAEWFYENIAKVLAGRLNVNLGLVFAALLLLAALFIFGCFKLRSKLALADKFAGWLEGIFSGFKSFKNVQHKPRFILYSVLLWTSYMLMCLCIFRALPMLSHLGLTDALFLFTVGNLSSLLPVPGGFGAYHYFVALALSGLYDVSWEIGILFATLIHETRSLMLVALGVVSLIFSQKRRTSRK